MRPRQPEAQRGDLIDVAVVAERARSNPMEQEMTGLAPPSTPATTDACGCTPRSAPAAVPHTSADQPSEQSTPMETATAPEIPRRSLKLVVTLTPTEGGEYRATLALGAEDCDPVLRSTTVAALSDALDQVPTLHREAEASWQLHPRNPAATRAAMQRSEADRRRPARSTVPPVDQPTLVQRADVPADAVPPTPQATEGAVTPRPAGGGQLTLFG